MVRNNPFSSPIFTSKWTKHFSSKEKEFKSSFIKGLSFYKSSFLPIYTNIGRNLTKGIFYSFSDKNVSLAKGKILFVFDVASYFKVEKSTTTKQKRIKQYPGYLIKLDNYSDLKNYLTTTFSKKSIQKLNRYKRRLELCFDIKYKVYHGHIEKENYDFIFYKFNELLTKRFEDKKITNNNLDPREWQFYYDVVYPLILEKKASLFVVYNNETPIAIRLNYYSENIVFDAITVFDIDYNKFHLGKISLLAKLEWAFNTNYKIFDFSKGYFDYKESWSDTKYDFEYHVLYNSKSLLSSTIASLIINKYSLKQYLRDKAINEKLHRFTFLLKKNKNNNTKQKLEVLDSKTPNEKDFNVIDINNSNYSFLKSYAYDFLFLNSEHIDNLKVFKASSNNTTTFLFKGTKNELLLKLQ